MNALEYLGSVPLFLGIGASNWQLSTFADATKQAKALGVTSILVKIADGGNQWYGALGGWQKVLETVKQAGLIAIPYTYSYGNKFGALQAEISILTAAMEAAGIVIADMETEWNGQTIWAHQLSDVLKSVSGIFGVTTWADPVQQNWTGVCAALKPCVNFWLPQVYSDFLASVYHTQFAPYGLPAYPVLNLGSDFGANNIMQIVQASHSPVIALWWYGPAIGAYSATVKQIAAMLTPTPVAGVPAGWHDDGHTLTAPNTVPVILGFRDYVLSNKWDPGNWPLEPEHDQDPLEISNPSLGKGRQQIFRWKGLGYTPGRGAFEQWLGQEMLALRARKTPVTADAANDILNAVGILQGAHKKLAS